MVAPKRIRWHLPVNHIVNAALILILFGGLVSASVGDRLPEFRECVEVRGTAAQRLNLEGDKADQKMGGLMVILRTADMQA